MSVGSCHTCIVHTYLLYKFRQLLFMSVSDIIILSYVHNILFSLCKDIIWQYHNPSPYRRWKIYWDARCFSNPGALWGCWGIISFCNVLKNFSN